MPISVIHGRALIYRESSQIVELCPFFSIDMDTRDPKPRWRKTGSALLLILFAMSMVQLIYFVGRSDGMAWRARLMFEPSPTPDPCLGYARDQPRDEVITNLSKLILVTASLKRTDIRKMLLKSLNSSEDDVRLKLCRLMEFNKTYRCSNCSAMMPLPRTALSTDVRLRHSATWKGHALPIMVTQSIGRLGNVLGEYASLYALHRIYNVTAFITPKHKTIVNIFPNLSLKQIEVATYKDWKKLGSDVADEFSYTSLQLAAAGLLGPHKFISNDFPFERQLFNAFREDILHEFTFSDLLLNKTALQLAGVQNKAVRSFPDQPITFIGVHIRLTDYPNHMMTRFGVTVTYDKYLTRAVEYYRRLYNNTAFVVTSDNQSYSRSFFKNLGENNTFIFSGSPAGDMCLLAHCNHSIVTFGTYGFWTGYLSPGTTVYPDIPSKKPYPHSRPFYEQALLHNFIPLPLL